MPLTQVQGAMVGPTGFANLSGITFPATQVPSADANTLDDYEEGTWTPSVGGNATYTRQSGFYTKIGRQVVAMFDIEISTIGTGSQSIISGLPFTSAPAGSPQGIVAPISYWTNLTTAISWFAWRVDEGTTILRNAYTTSAATSAVANGNILQNGSRVIGTATYFV